MLSGSDSMLGVLKLDRRSHPLERGVLLLNHLKYSRMTVTRNLKKMLAFRAQKELGAQIFVVWRYVLGLLGFGVYYMYATGPKTNAIDSILRSSWKLPWKYSEIPVLGKKSNDCLGDSACINTLSSSKTIRLGYGNIRQHFPNRFWSINQWKYVFLGKLELWVLDLVTSIL